MEAKTESYQNSKFLSVDLDKLAGKKDDLKINKGNEADAERLRGLIRKNISFSAVVYGYRGTGKTSFVDHVLKDFNDRVIIRFNATNYDDYPKFLKRFIRELYLAIKDTYGDENLAKYENLRNIYRHTFYDITESTKEENEKVRTVTRGMSLSAEAISEKTVDICTAVALALAECSVLLSKGPLPLDIHKLTAAVITALVTLGINVLLKITLKLFYEKKYEKKKSNSNSRTEESLYDDEIAEYHVFNELKAFNKNSENGDNADNSNKVIFVLDELDKLGEEDIKTIIKDLKPLILSENVISILVAGKNYERFLEDEQDDTDAIAGNLFSQKIYVPLSGIERATEIINSMVTESGSDPSPEKTEYINEKIITSEGVIRNMINLVLGDITWDKDDQARIMLEGENKAITSSNVMKRSIKSLTDLEDYVSQRFSTMQNAKTDEMFKLAYRISRYIRENNIEYNKEGRTLTKTNLEDYIKENTSHLDDKDIDIVFEKMFGQGSDEDSKTIDFDGYKITDDLIPSHISEENTDPPIDDFIYEVFKKLFGIALKNIELDSLHELLDDVKSFIIYFAKGDIVLVHELTKALLELGLSSNDYDSYKDFRSSDSAVNDALLISELSLHCDIVEQIEPLGYEGKSYILNSYKIFSARCRVAEELVRIYYWMTKAPTCKYSDTDGHVDKNIPYKWDLAHAKGDCLNVVDVKFYRRNYTNAGTINSVYLAAKKLLKLEKVNKVNEVLVIFIPGPINESLEGYKEAAKDFLRHADQDTRSRMSLSVCYIPYTIRNEFNKGLAEFDEVISNPYFEDTQSSSKEKVMNALSALDKDNQNGVSGS